MRDRAARAFKTCVTVAFLCWPLAVNPASAQGTRITLGYSSADATYGPWFYGQEKGYFQKHGFESTLVFFDSGTKGVQGLIGGAVDICAADAQAVMNAKLGGADVVFIAATLGVLSGNVYAGKDITDPAQIKGKKWAISSFGSEAQLAALMALKSFGIDATDVTLVQVGNQGNRLAALEAGQVQATTLLPPITAKAEAMGFRKLAQLPDLAPNYFSLGAAVTSETLQKRREVLKRFLEALADATAAYKKDRAGGTTAIQKFLKADEKDAAVAWDYFAPLEPADLRPAQDSFKTHLENSSDPKAKTATTADFVDLSLLDELDKAGFFKTLN